MHIFIILYMTVVMEIVNDNMMLQSNENLFLLMKRILYVIVIDYIFIRL